MPAKIDKIRINVELGEEFDRRKKLTSEQRQEIKELYETGEYTQRELGRLYGVDRRVIANCVNPEKAKLWNKNNYKSKKSKGVNYYKSDKMKEHRDYKRSIQINLVD
jgi:hypothetical protein